MRVLYNMCDSNNTRSRTPEITKNSTLRTKILIIYGRIRQCAFIQRRLHLRASMMYTNMLVKLGIEPQPI
jgi:hypothetical protein